MTDAATPGRLEQLEELIQALRPVVLAAHSEHGLQGLSGLVGQYRAAMKEADELRAVSAPPGGTALDELNRRRRAKGAEMPSPRAPGQNRRGE